MQLPGLERTPELQRAHRGARLAAPVDAHGVDWHAAAGAIVQRVATADDLLDQAFPVFEVLRRVQRQEAARAILALGRAQGEGIHHPALQLPGFADSEAQYQHDEAVCLDVDLSQQEAHPSGHGTGRPNLGALLHLVRIAGRARRHRHVVDRPVHVMCGLQRALFTGGGEGA